MGQRQRKMDALFQDSLVRFLKCLSDENEAKVLGKALKREVLYRALCGEQAELVQWKFYILV